MQRTVKFWCLLIGLFTTTAIFGQSSATSANSDFNSSNISLDSELSEDWSFFQDELNQIYYIDFESFNFNLSEIIVKDKEGTIILREDVLDLPVNSIYELDCSQYKNGDYTVEIRSFTKTLSKSISVK